MVFSDSKLNIGRLEGIRARLLTLIPNLSPPSALPTRTIDW